MQTKIKIGTAILSLALIVLLSIPSEAEVYVRPKPSEAEVYVRPKPNLDYLSEYATQYGVSYKVLYNVMMCESGGLDIPPGHNDGGLAYGIFQYHEQTFDMFAKKLGKEMDYHSSKDQIELTAWAFSKGLQSHWTCYKLVVK